MKGRSPALPIANRIRIGRSELEFVRIAATRPQTPVLVFLHEGLGSLALWREFPAHVAQRSGFGALIFSRSGNGFSSTLVGPRNPAYMHEEALETLPELLATLEIERTVLVGHSDGASIALIYAAERPHAVAGLILEAPHVFVEDRSIEGITAAKREYETSDLRARMARHHADGDRTFYGWNDIWLSPEFRTWNIEATLKQVRAPILAIQGADDRYGTFAQIDAVTASARVTVDRILLGRCGHAPHRDRPAIVEAVAVAWLGENVAADR